MNLKEGDINGRINGQVVYKIDLKVAEPNYNGYIGTIDLNSILNFSIDPKAIYLCTTCDGDKYVVVKGSDVWRRFNSPYPCLLQTKHPGRYKEIRSSLEKYSNKFYKTPYGGVSPYDYMGSVAINQIAQ